MKRLKDILKDVEVLSLKGDVETPVAGLSIDSRLVEEGFLYAAIRGTQADGHSYISQAIEKGATAIIHSEDISVYRPGVHYIRVADTSESIGWVASAYYGEPSRYMKVVGITGTNGKTTIATLLYKTLTELGYSTGLISTVRNMIGEEAVAATHTTPDAISVQALLHQMKVSGCEYVFMEVSSHAVHQHRIAGLLFAGGVFSNITHDHLDYHKTFNEYINVKKRFFDSLDAGAFALTNIDDKRGAVMIQNTKAEVSTYSLRQAADYKAKILENEIYGLLLNIDDKDVHFRIAGTFNAYNILAVFGSLVELGFDRAEVLSVLSNITGAEGRFEVYRSLNEGITGVIDYAHTPDALLNVLQTIQKFEGYPQLITVVGCGGDRDRSKRPVMAMVACEHSDKVILTSDNPRTEDPQSILNDMMEGLAPQHLRKAIQIIDREQAIRTAVMMAQKGDIILVAGKGHETYQEVNGKRYPFDDTEKLLEIFKQLNK